MAVVQISKIQIRRGLKNSSTGVPQLSSAELAWAVDSQELFIGNGSVTEGAPYVGNTKILTEHDNILELASSYQFGFDEPSIQQSVSRSLQDKIDEIEVSVLDYGAVPDGSTDNVDAFELAFTELFRNSDTKFKKILKIPNGTYKFSRDLTIPGTAQIRGETQNNTILDIDTNNITFISENGTAFTGFTSTDRPRDINISNLTIKRSTGQVVFSGVADSKITDVKFKGEYSLGGEVTSFSSIPSAVFWSNILAATKVDNLTFANCAFENNSISVKCLQSLSYETTIYFDTCRFFENYTSIFVSGVENQTNRWFINDCRFEEIADEVITMNNGIGTRIQRCSFKNCGNGVNDATSPSSLLVSFGQNNDNVIYDCTSDRQQQALTTRDPSTPAISEIFNSSFTKFIDRNHAPIYLSDSFTPMAVFSAYNRFIVINYHLKLGPTNGQYSRYGRLLITIGDDLAGEQDVSAVSITDEYQYSPRFLASEGGSLMTNFEFNVGLADDKSLDGSSIDTIVLYYKNPLNSGALGNISFDVSYGV